MTQQRKLAVRRLLAFLVDYGVMVLFVAGLSVAGFAIRAQLGVTRSALTTFPEKLLAQALIVATVTLPIVLYFAVSESSRWQATIGKRVLRLQVTADRGGRPR
ncbi:MAG: RDD family protein, partial [Planctomycetota bacterium]|nr:RDD family protein [Planctomycetota bacterium]